MSRHTLLLLSFSPISSDPRVMRQVRLFAEDYHVITCGYGPKPEEAADHIEIPVAYKPWRLNKIAGALLVRAHLYRRLYFSSPRAQLVGREVARRGGVDIVLANDVFAVPLAVALKPRLGVHADLHEYSPGQGSSRVWVRWTRPFLVWACQQYVTQVASVTTTSPGFAAEYEEVFGVHADVVPNATRHRADLAPTPTPSTIRLVHAGAAGRPRKLEIMIDAVKDINARTPGRYTLDVYLVPGDATYIRELGERAGDPAITGVRLQEPVAFDELVPMMHRYDVGVFICPPTTFNLVHTLPNKIFEFVQARLGLIVSPSPSIAPLVRDHGVGVVTEGYESADLVQVLESLTVADVERYKAASHAAAEELSAERLSAPWVDGVSALAARASGPRAAAEHGRA
ncbi:glycosyltransferase family 4 protein [Georgenia sp. SYP-B2076]|uniref:glycosyltransferase family 4 protein n=1 Tax=Georgenia sp. SYP-B2076 TaxID=2495881 RepID=UPI000F8CFCC0|nr:glycosyltransferase family 4 protein [Georgenia sp. SYP-B2076]